MTKIYYHKTGSPDSARYVEYPMEEAKKLLIEALEEHRILKNMVLNFRVFDVSKIKEDDIIRVLPIVGGG